MRQPTFRRSRVRQQRLLRTGIGVVVLVGLAAVITNVVSDGGEPNGGDGPPPTPQVAFTGKATSYADSGNLRGADKVKKSRVRSERARILTLLNGWYQQTFVNPSVFVVDTTPEGGATQSFPPADATAAFSNEARATLAQDIDSMTLGADRTSFARVEPTRAKARLTIFFEKAKRPSVATAVVTFHATGTLKDASAPAVAIAQEAQFTLEMTERGWRVAFYEARQTQDSILPSPSPTETT